MRYIFLCKSSALLLYMGSFEVSPDLYKLVTPVSHCPFVIIHRTTDENPTRQFRSLQWLP